MSEEVLAVTYDIVGVDMPCMDLNLNTDRFPKPNGGACINRLSWQGGGKVSSGMAAAARLGARCAMLGAVGDDAFGRFCVEDFNRHNINTAALTVRPGASTSLSVVLSDRETGGRSIVSKPGSVERYRFAEFNRDYLTRARYFFICSVDDETLPALRLAREAGAKTVIDADQYDARVMEHLSELDIFIASEFVYDALFDNDDYETNTRHLLEKGPSTVIFTLGDKGCAGVGADGYFRWPGHTVEAVDTVGAGDVFHGAFIASMVQGVGVAESARRANAAAAVKCTRIGGRAGVPDMPALLAFLDTGVIDYADIDRRVAFYENFQFGEGGYV